MKYKNICGLYFSATGNTKKVVQAMAQTACERSKGTSEKKDECASNVDFMVAPEFFDVTLPEGREKEYIFKKEDLVIIGAPTYAGKLPNKIMPFFRGNLKGNGAKCIAVVTYGNRSFDNAAAELTSILTTNGFDVLAVAAIVSEHSFSEKLAAGRPNEKDLNEICAWVSEVLANKNKDNLCHSIIPGDAEAGYYVPKQINGQPAVFLKAKPETDVAKCIRCGKCVDSCPMGSIDKADPVNISGICIKCQACIKVCPARAKFFSDEQFLSHVEMLELNFAQEKQNFYLVLSE